MCSTYDAVFNAVCDCGAFMAAFGSDISSERCHKLIRRGRKISGNTLCGVVNPLQPSTSQQCARTAHLGGDKDRCSFLCDTYEMIKSRPTITNTYVSVCILYVHGLLGRLWKKRYSVPFPCSFSLDR